MRRKSYSCEELNKGAWTAIEDSLLINYMNIHGEGKWTTVPYKSGLKRSGKSCRLRWLNYLRPSVKRGNFSEEEDDLIVRLHKLLGNRWSLIAGRLPGRTDNDIKNYWNTTLGKKAKQPSAMKKTPISNALLPSSPSSSPSQATNKTTLIRTKAIRYNKLARPLFLQSLSASKPLGGESKSMPAKEMPESSKVGFNVEEEDDMVLNYGNFNDDIIVAFPDHAECDRFMEFDRWMMNDEDVGYLPDDDQIKSLISMFDVGGEF